MGNISRNGRLRKYYFNNNICSYCHRIYIHVLLFKKKERKKEKIDYRCVAAMSFDKICCFKSIEKPRLRKDASVYFYVCCNIIMSGTEREVSLGATVERSLTKTLKIILNLVLLVL